MTWVPQVPAWSAAEIENWSQGSGIPKENVDNLAKELYNSSYYKLQKLGDKDWALLTHKHSGRFQNSWDLMLVTLTLRSSGMNCLNKLGRDPKKWDVDPVVSDLMTTDLFSQIRNRGMAALELGEKFDMMDTDGPMQNIAQRLLCMITR